MKKNLTLLILLLMLISCEREEVRNDSSINSIRLFREDVLIEEYQYYNDNRLYTLTRYDNYGRFKDSCIYYYLDDKIIDHALLFDSHLKEPLKIDFVYDQNKLVGIHGPVLYSLQYNNDKISIAEFFGGEYSYHYTYNSDDNVLLKKHYLPNGHAIDSIKYDNNTNPLFKFFHYDLKDLRFFSQNNIIEDNYYYIEHWINDQGGVGYNEKKEVKRFFYSYNDIGLPITMIEYSLVFKDSIYFRFEYN